MNVPSTAPALARLSALALLLLLALPHPAPAQSADGRPADGQPVAAGDRAADAGDRSEEPRDPAGDARDRAGDAHPATAQSRTGPTDAAELEAFMDGVMMAHLRDKRIAGATVAVVRDGGVLLTKGYGFADVRGRVPVDPDSTLFRIGSVTKLFTYTGVMQLVEERRLGLDDDVNDHLDFTIPDTFPEPITIRHLLQHTGGLEEDSRHLFTDNVEDLQTMAEWLPERLPARVRPPGTYSAYSNYGTSLAGYIVGRVSGMSWDEYTEVRILEPLGMTLTTGRQPLPDHLEPHMSHGYALEAGTWKPRDFELVNGNAPAGSVSSTAADMARFMIAHLQEGELDGVRILEPGSARQMHQATFHHDPRINGYGFGFYEKSSHGVRIIGHGGNTRWFHTDLALFPDLDLGVFVSYNSAPGGELSFGPFLTAFLDHYFPTVHPHREATEEEIEEAQGLAGTYQFNRMAYTTFQKAFGLAGAIDVDVTEEGDLLLGLFGPPVRWVREEGGLYREEMGETRLAFRTDGSGRATHAFISAAPMMALERVAWHGLPTLHYAILGGGLAVFLGILLAAGIRFGRRRLWGAGPGEPHTAPGTAPALRMGRRSMVVTSAALVVFAVWMGILVSDFWALLTGSMLGLRLALILPVLGLLAVLVAGAALIQAIARKEGARWARLRLGGGVTVALLFVWSLHYWNLLGWRL